MDVGLKSAVDALELNFALTFGAIRVVLGPGFAEFEEASRGFLRAGVMVFCFVFAFGALLGAAIPHDMAGALFGSWG